jgi:nucleotide-binding universal stress UspA family protein
MAAITSGSVVVPWDFSDDSRNALSEAFRLAESPAKVEVVHVVPYPDWDVPAVAWITFSEDDIREKVTAGFRAEFPESGDRSPRFVVLFGDPGSQIAEHAADIKAGLIVVSSHGRTGFARMMLGSVAERVVRLAPCPVLVLRSAERD